MPTKKKTTKKSRTKKPASKKPAVKASAAKTAKPAAKATKPTSQSAAAQSRTKWAIWVPLLVVAVPLLFSVLYVVNRPADKSDSGVSSQSSDGVPSGLKVVPGQEGGASSTDASGALQPQPTGLQQSQSDAQKAGGLNLQAQTTPDQTTIR